MALFFMVLLSGELQSNPYLPRGYVCLFKILQRAHQAEFDGYNVYEVKLIRHSEGFETSQVFYIYVNVKFSAGDWVAAKEMVRKKIRLSHDGDTSHLEQVPDRVYDDQIPLHLRGKDKLTQYDYQHFNAYEGAFQLMK